VKKYIVSALLLAATQSFALDNCINFPVSTQGEEVYRGVISEVSEMTSFSGCPSSTLVNETLVFSLIKIENYNEEKRCVYSNGRAHFMCQL